MRSASERRCRLPGRRRKYALAALTAILLAGCGTQPTGFFDLARQAVASGKPAPEPSIDPRLRYLRAELGDKTAYLVLGYTEPGPQGTTEVYYTARGEVLKLRDGRLVGTAGLPLDWREVRQGGAPDWASVPSSPVEYRRARDVMPGYRFNIREAVNVRALAPSHDGRSAGPLRWFEETSRSLDGAATLPPARFAVHMKEGAPARVVASEQCLAPAVCLRLQAWPPEAEWAGAVELRKPAS